MPAQHESAQASWEDHPGAAPTLQRVKWTIAQMVADKFRPRAILSLAPPPEVSGEPWAGKLRDGWLDAISRSGMRGLLDQADPLTQGADGPAPYE